MLKCFEYKAHIHLIRQESASWKKFFTIPESKLEHPSLFQNLILTLNYICKKVPEKLNQIMQGKFEQIYLALCANPVKNNCPHCILELITTLVTKSNSMALFMIKNGGLEIAKCNKIYNSLENF